MKLKHKVALVTGSGRGIGKAVALAFAREGAAVMICARTRSEVEESVREIRSLKADCDGATCDVSLEEPVNELVGRIQKQFGGLDVLVNNAGESGPSLNASS